MRQVFSGHRDPAAFTARLRVMLAGCCVVCLGILALQNVIARRFRASHAPPAPAGAAPVATFDVDGSSDESSDEEAAAGQRRQRPQGMSLGAAWVFLRQSPQIRCLAVVALSQGITSNLLDLAWKHHLHRLAVTPGAYSAVLGDTAMWTGMVTGGLMLLSPTLFGALGWEGVAKATPRVMLLAGTPFFLGCIAYNFFLTGLGWRRAEGSGGARPWDRGSDRVACSALPGRPSVRMLACTVERPRLRQACQVSSVPRPSSRPLPRHPRAHTEATVMQARPTLRWRSRAWSCWARCFR